MYNHDRTANRARMAKVSGAGTPWRLAADCELVILEGVGVATLVIASAVAPPLITSDSWLPVPGGCVALTGAPLASVITAVDPAESVLDGTSLSLVPVPEGPDMLGEVADAREEVGTPEVVVETTRGGGGRAASPMKC